MLRKGSKGRSPQGVGASILAKVRGLHCHGLACQENYTLAPRFSTPFHHKVENFSGIQCTGFLLRFWFYQVVIPAFFNGLHERFGNPYTYIEISDIIIILLTGYKLKNVGIHAQNSHVGASACTALLDRLCCRVETFMKLYRSACNTAS